MLADLLSTAELPISSSQAQLLIWGAIAVLFLGAVSALKGITDIIRFFKGDPPSEQRYASKADLANVRGEIASIEKRQIALITEWKRDAEKDREKLASDIREVFVEVRAIHRSLGRLEAVPSNKG